MPLVLVLKHVSKQQVLKFEKTLPLSWKQSVCTCLHGRPTLAGREHAPRYPTSTFTRDRLLLMDRGREGCGGGGRVVTEGVLHWLID